MTPSLAPARPPMSRRRFLSLAAAGTAAGWAGPALWSQLAAATPAAGSRQSGSSSGRTLVLVTLYGGNDARYRAAAAQISAGVDAALDRAEQPAGAVVR